MTDRMLAESDAGWETCRIRASVDAIGYVVSITEAYDNCFLVRTETKGLGLLRVWYPRKFRSLLDQLFLEMSGEFDIEVLEYAEGMAGLDEIFPP